MTKATEKTSGPQGSLERQRFDKAVVLSGHVIDRPDRSQPRFPPELEEPVTQAVDDVLAGWGIGPGDLAISGAARGADVIGAERCLRRGVAVWLLVALEESEFIEQSVRLPGSDWEARYHSLRERCETRFQPVELGPPPPGQDPFSVNNRWALDLAAREVGERGLHVLLVWDEQPVGEGPGGTSHLASEARRLGAHLAIVNPILLHRTSPPS